MSENLYDLALKAQQEGDIDTAIRCYRDLHEKNPENMEVTLLLGILYGQQKAWSQAITFYKKAIAIDPNHENTFFNLALAELSEKRTDDAIINLQNTLKINPNHAKARRQLAQILQQRGEFKEAISHYQFSIHDDPDHVDTYINLGAALISTGDIMDAIQQFNKALVLDPQNFEAHYNLGAIYLNAKNLEQALIHYISLLDKHSSPEIYYNIGVIYMYQNRQSDAIGFLRQAIDYDNTYFDAHVNLGVCYLKIHDIAKAAEHYQIAHNIRPNNHEISYLLDALQQKNTQNSAPKDFVRNLFDQYAPYFEKHLMEHLDYQSPQKLYDAVCKIIPAHKTNLVILDLGCGTGLCGTLFKKSSKKLIGVDISPMMVNEAKSKNLYDEIIIEDIVHALDHLKQNDLILAADVFGYIGDLDKIFSLAHAALNKEGIFAFTIEKQDDSINTDYHLEQTARFTHSAHYIQQLSKKYGFNIALQEEITLRKQNNTPLQGLLFILK